MTEAVKEKRRRGEHSSTAANRQKILDATLKVAHEYGYQGTTIPRVSRRANLPTGSVYWHFESKDMLFASLMDQSMEWLQDFNANRRPREGESTREHLMRIYTNQAAPNAVGARDFWRLGIILSMEQSVREQVSRQRFLDLRAGVLEEYTSWFAQTLPAELQAQCPNRAADLAKFQLACVDGNFILTASGDSMPAFPTMAALSLISLAEAPPSVLP